MYIYIYIATQGPDIPAVTARVSGFENSMGSVLDGMGI